MKNEALRYLKGGFSIIPIGPNKNPLVLWKKYQMRRATEDELLGWWKTWPEANIGIICGKISGISVVDCDSEKGVAIVEELLPESCSCPVVQTPSGGRHYYFSYQPELKTRARLLSGIDIRNDGGLVVAPPSKTKFGHYRWIRQWKA